MDACVGGKSDFDMDHIHLVLPARFFTPSLFQILPQSWPRRLQRKMSSLGLRKGGVFIKFGQRVHMEALHERGALRIQPAHFFSHKDHTGAVRDDELTLPISIALSRDDVVKLVRNPQDIPPNASDQRVDIRFTWPTDYWLYCVTSSIEPRLFVDFNADACVIVRDRATLRECCAKQVHCI